MGYLTLGDHSYGTIKIIGGKYGKVKVGKYTSIADEVKVISVGHNPNCITTFPFNASIFKDKFGTPPGIKTHPVKYGDVEIGNDCWIGYGATIMGGTVIHDGAIVGANAFVANDLPAYSIAGGIPAAIIRLRFTPRQICQLLKIKWWNWPDEKIQKNIELLCSEDISKFINSHLVP